MLMSVRVTCAVLSSASFFQDGLKTADKLKQYIEKLAADLYNVNTHTFPVSSPAEGCSVFMHTCLALVPLTQMR